MGDRNVEFGDRRRGEGADGETSDDRRRLVVSTPVKKPGQESQDDAELAGVAGVVVVADCQRAVVERGRMVSVFGLDSEQAHRHV